jgi:hypothetical protein
MAKEYNMIQCHMHRNTPAGKQHLTAWIPEKFATPDRILKLQDQSTKEWEDGWKVVSVGTSKVSSSIIAERSQDYKHTREASDI